MDKFEKTNKRGNISKKKTWYNWLINYIPQSTKKRESDAKDKIMNLFKTNTTKYYSKPARAKNVYGGRKKPRKLKIQKNLKTTLKI